MKPQHAHLSKLLWYNDIRYNVHYIIIHEFTFTQSISAVYILRDNQETGPEVGQLRWCAIVGLRLGPSVCWVGLGCVRLRFFFRALGLDSTNEIFCCKLVAWTVTFLLSYCPSLQVNLIVESLVPVINILADLYSNSDTILWWNRAISGPQSYGVHDVVSRTTKQRRRGMHEYLAREKLQMKRRTVLTSVLFCLRRSQYWVNNRPRIAAAG